MTSRARFGRELVARDEWARCVMGCRIGRVGIACGAGDQVTRGSAAGWVLVLGGSRTGRG
jgi:hypothetical protein